MYVYKIGYRHANGEVEGFVGVGSTGEASRVNAINKVSREVEAKLLKFELSRILDSMESVTAVELVTLREDWRCVPNPENHWELK
jgi:hypothetical protein